MFDIYKFKYAVSKRGFTLKDVAAWLGINIATLYRKMNGISDFTRNEIFIICSRLHLSNEETFSIFLSHKLHICNLNTGNHIVKKVWKKKILPIHISRN